MKPNESQWEQEESEAKLQAKYAGEGTAPDDEIEREWLEKKSR
jgi:hypothetical protein